MEGSNDYNLFLEFIDVYLASSFQIIDNESQLMQKLNSMTRENKQFFYVADMIDLKILFTSDNIKQVLGIEPSEYSPADQFSTTHPNDLQRYSVSRGKIMKLCGELLSSEQNYFLFSSNILTQRSNGKYVNIVYQGYAFYIKAPKPYVYALFICTDINWYGKIKNGYHFYTGNDMSFYRLPDKELIETGCIFTKREFEIIRMIRIGYDSIEIGKNLFISPHTVDTHRRNILKKTGKSNTSELIIELQEIGFI